MRKKSASMHNSSKISFRKYVFCLTSLFFKCCAGACDITIATLYSDKYSAHIDYLSTRVHVLSRGKCSLESDYIGDDGMIFADKAKETSLKYTYKLTGSPVKIEAVLDALNKLNDGEILLWLDATVHILSFADFPTILGMNSILFASEQGQINIGVMLMRKSAQLTSFFTNVLETVQKGAWDQGVVECMLNKQSNFPYKKYCDGILEDDVVTWSLLPKNITRVLNSEKGCDVGGSNNTPTTAILKFVGGETDKSSCLRFWKRKERKTRLLHLPRYLSGKSVVIIGPSEECSVHDFSDLVSADSVIVRLNLKQKSGNVLISEKVLSRSANRTDIVYHHAATTSETGVMRRKWRSETALSSETVEAYKKFGIKYIVCAEPFRCKHAKTYIEDGLKIEDLRLGTKLWARKGKFSTGLKAIADLLNYPIVNMTIICLDFHEGGTRKSYDKLYGDLSVPEGFSQVSLEDQSGVHNFSEEFEEFKHIYASEKDRIILTGKLASMVESTKNKEEEI